MTTRYSNQQGSKSQQDTAINRFNHPETLETHSHQEMSFMPSALFLILCIFARRDLAAPLFWKSPPHNDVVSTRAHAVITGFLSMDKLTVGGLSTTVTFGEMTMADLLENCDEMDGMMGMGPSNEDGQNAFEDMLDVG